MSESPAEISGTRAGVSRGVPGAVTAEELASQPDAWATALRLPPDQVALLPGTGEPTLVVGCGTSYYVGDAYAFLRTDSGAGRTRAAIPSELNWIDDEHIVVISRSGTTADVVELVRQRRRSHRITAILGAVDSPLGELCDRVVDLGFADERSIVQTRFATTVLTVLRASIGQASEALVDDARRALDRPLPAVPTDRPRCARRCSSATGGRSVSPTRPPSRCARPRARGPRPTRSANTSTVRSRPQAGTSLVWSFDPLPDSVASEVAATGATIYVDDLDPQAGLVLVHRLAVELARAGRDPDAPPFLNRSVLTPS